MFRAKNDALYLCDNGACYCGEHLGSTAKATGCDISGQKIERVTVDDALMAAKEFGVSLRCEVPSCKRAAA